MQKSRLKRVFTLFLNTMEIRILFFLFVLMSCSSAFAQLANSDIKSALVLSFNEVSLSGGEQKAVYLEMEASCHAGTCSIQEINTLLEKLPAANRNLSTFLKRQDFAINKDLSTDSLATEILASINDNPLVLSFMQRSETRPTEVHLSLVKWLTTFKDS